MPADKSSHKCLRICLGVSALFTIILATVILTLVLTVFKPKDPHITVHLVGLEKLQIITPTPNSTETLDVDITIENPNYEAFRYKNSTAYIKFHDKDVAHVHLETKFVQARSQIYMRASANFHPAKLTADPNFWADIGNGTLNLTSTAALPGKVVMFKVIKLKGTVYNWCNFSINVSSMVAESQCISKIKI
ncbi:hypothetical protein L6164_022225 [Bauhinia variegata]|uniref:Uncharacterized protein n=1 Tax=Bauhinia variegata TaxID=167791 RepID=A0ACB9MEF3_BAUVA|nr:hypothetical protein L6164_022225 [Bauhinia variegata]